MTEENKMVYEVLGRLSSEYVDFLEKSLATLNDFKSYDFQEEDNIDLINELVREYDTKLSREQRLLKIYNRLLGKEG